MSFMRNTQMAARQSRGKTAPDDHIAPMVVKARAAMRGYATEIGVNGQARIGEAVTAPFDNGLPFTLSMGRGTWQGNWLGENLNWCCFVNITHLVIMISEDKPNEQAQFGAYWAKYGK